MLCVLVWVICHDLFHPSYFRKHGRGQGGSAGKLRFFCDLSVMKHPFHHVNVTMSQLIVMGSVVRGLRRRGASWSRRSGEHTGRVTDVSERAGVSGRTVWYFEDYVPGRTVD